MNEIIDRKHSGFGIASSLIGVFNLSYPVILVFDDSNGSNGFLYHLTRIGPGGLLGLVFILLFYLIIPVIGNGLGLLVGLVGLFQNTYKKPFAILGLVMNAITSVMFLIGCLLFIFRN
jgi:hypothetical protein